MKTTIKEIRKVNTGGIEIHYETEKICISKDFEKPSSTKRFYNHYVVIPKESLNDLKLALKDKRW